MTSCLQKSVCVWGGGGGGGGRGPQLKDCLSARVLNVQEAKNMPLPVQTKNVYAKCFFFQSETPPPLCLPRYKLMSFTR